MSKISGLLLIMLSCTFFCCRQPMESSRANDKKEPGTRHTEGDLVEGGGEVNQAYANSKEIIGQAPREIADRRGEPALSNFVSDAIYYQTNLNSDGAIDLAVISTTSLKSSIPQGAVTVADVYKIMPDDEDLVVIYMGGQILQRLFDLAAAKNNFAFANATYTVQGGRAFDIKINRQTLQSSKTYAVATNRTLSGEIAQMFSLAENIKSDPAGVTTRGALIGYIRHLTAAGKPVEAEQEARVFGLD